MMTSLDMHGFSVSLLPVSKTEEALLQAPVAPWVWPGCLALGPVSILPLPDGLSPIQPLPSKNDDTRRFIEKCCNILIASEDDLNALDAKSGDGDTGSTLATAARALLTALDRMPLADLTPALPCDRGRTQPDDGWVVRGVAGDLLRGCGRRVLKRQRFHRCAEGRP